MIDASVLDEPKPGYFLKLKRAAELHEFVNEKFAGYVKLQMRFNTSNELKGAEEWQVLTWEIAAPPDEMFGVWVGEIIHHARSALDHLVYARIRANGQDPGEHSQFPIYDSEKLWIRDIESRGRRRFWVFPRRTRKPSPVRGLPDNELAIIKAAQPYHVKGKHRPRHPLMQLLRMSNIDKHQTLHAVSVRIGGQQTISYEPRGFYAIAAKKNLAPQGSPIYDGTELGRIKPRLIQPPPPGVNVQVRARGLAGLAFSEEGKPPIATLAEIGDILRMAADVVNNLDPDVYIAFPERPSDQV